MPSTPATSSFPAPPAIRLRLAVARGWGEAEVGASAAGLWAVAGLVGVALAGSALVVRAAAGKSPDPR